jgi:hypothetical protein
MPNYSSISERFSDISIITGSCDIEHTGHQCDIVHTGLECDIVHRAQKLACAQQPSLATVQGT